MKKICFRFDVDTYLCAFKGVSNLIELGNKNDVNFTFFYNMGRSIHIPSIFKANKNEQHEPCADKLSNLKKLGFRGYITTSLLNPLVGAAYPEIIVAAYQNGHEIGLHGGTNHGDWMRNAQSWSDTKIMNEITWGLSKLNNIGIRNVTSFSSPGWCAPSALNNILVHNSFRVVADRYGHGMEEIIKIENNNTNNALNSVPTNLLGMPCGVGYIEHMRAKHMSDNEIVEKFRSDLKKINQLAVIYDHPYYSGIKELPILEIMIHEARSMGFCLTTFNELT